MEVIYKNNKTSKRRFGSNRSYWTRFFNSLGLSPNQWKNNNGGFDEFYPFYVFLPDHSTRMVRLELLDIDPDEYEREQNDWIFITSWVDDREFEDKTIKELVIALLQTKHNVRIAKRMIQEWFEEHDVDVLAQINDIYNHHEKELV